MRAHDLERRGTSRKTVQIAAGTVWIALAVYENADGGDERGIGKRESRKDWPEEIRQCKTPRDKPTRISLD